jgi:hypothetical protein
MASSVMRTGRCRRWLLISRKRSLAGSAGPSARAAARWSSSVTTAAGCRRATAGVNVSAGFQPLHPELDLVRHLADALQVPALPAARLRCGWLKVGPEFNVLEWSRSNSSTQRRAVANSRTAARWSSIVMMVWRLLFITVPPYAVADGSRRCQRLGFCQLSFARIRQNGVLEACSVSY